jgi:DNA-binding GntR family transcriptional regulator
MAPVPSHCVERGDLPDSTPAQRRQSDEAYEAISRAIVRCDLAPGTTVSEAELAGRLNLKTAAARAAVDRLSVVGLLRPMHRRGYVVKPITLRDVNDLFQLRTIIEVAVVRLAAGRVDAVSLQRLDLVRNEGYQPGDRDSEAKFIRANTEFHLVVARATGNERLILALAQTLSEMERLFHFGLAMRNRTAEMREEHQALIAALARGDADEAERVTREELESSKAMVISAFMSSDSLLDVSISGTPTPAVQGGRA